MVLSVGRRLLLLWLILAPPVALAADLRDLVDSARASVVAVGTYKETDSPRFSFRGTGFVVGDGSSVVTNFHVLPSAVESASNPTLMVLVPEGRQATGPRIARVIASDLNHDLALLSIEGAPLPALRLGGDELVREGTDVAFLGFPIGGVLGFLPVTHRGIVASDTHIALPAANAHELSAQSVERLREGPFDIYQLDATAYPGNSGGPLFDIASGRVVGVINMVLVRQTRESALTNPTGITYAIPVKFVNQLLSRR